MSITEKTIQILEFDKIRQMLSDVCHTDGAKQKAMMLTPQTDPEVVLRRQRYTADARRLYDRKGMPPFGSVKDVLDACERAGKGAVLSMPELLQTAGVLRTARLLKNYLYDVEQISTSLDEWFSLLMPDRDLEETIFRSIIAEDALADEASKTLAEIRRKKRVAGQKIKEALQKYLSGNASKYLQENIVTTRNGRYVVPVKVEHKSEVPGLIHDTSASGATVFVEPMAVVDANNELRVLESKEAHEIERILAELSAKVADRADQIRLDYRNITEIAFSFGCAELASSMRAVSPTFSEGKTVNLLRARHPLIDREKVVPVDISIGDGYDTMIITGPNTGGKTVTLKTLGLLTLMAQAGLQIPASENSAVCVFEHVLVDLGDEQSIEMSLSTFSSHMVKIVDIMQNVDEKSLVLFDELGAGTDPVEGAALAEAIIERVREAGAVSAVTTHYAELKAYALNTPGVINASCEFDVTTLRPTYRLIIGAPGKSNAFAIAEKLGLEQGVISRAEKLLSSSDRQFEDVISKLEQSRIEMERNRDASAKEREDYELFKREAEKRIREREEAAEKELEQARRKALAMVQSAKASSDYILEEMDKLRRSRDADDLSDRVRKARAEMKKAVQKSEDMFEEQEKEETEEPYVLPRQLRKGDMVYMTKLRKNGVVTELPDKSGNVTVQAGILTTRVKIDTLRLVEDEPAVVDKEGKKKAASGYSVQVSGAFSPELDLRGLTGEEAWIKVDRYLDEAVLHNVQSVSLIHGKGTGALRASLWQFLKGDRRIAAYRLGQYGEGDAGVTVVSLK